MARNEIAGTIMLAAVACGVVVLAPARESVAATNYGCFKVKTPSLNIRFRPYSDAQVIGTAEAGDILEKRKRWCTLRGYWCAVRKGTLEGYADKTYLEKVPCP
jgi:hypothetical protein